MKISTRITRYLGIEMLSPILPAISRLPFFDYRAWDLGPTTARVAAVLRVETPCPNVYLGNVLRTGKN